MGFSTNLCKLMEANNINSYKLAKGIGVHISTVTNWKDGANPKVEHLKRVADFFGVTTDALLSSDLSALNVGANRVR